MCVTATVTGKIPSDSFKFVRGCRPMKKRLSILYAVLMLLVAGACEKGGSGNPVGDDTDNSPADTTPTGQQGGTDEWLVPSDEVIDVGLGIDPFPALLNPKFVPAGEDISLLRENDLVLGIKIGDEVRAYPHAILDWHEIINDTVSDLRFTVSYCPLTGTGIGFERTINGTATTFGVSGMLYFSNLILYDRLAESKWSQMLLLSINGPSIGERFKPVQLFETEWRTWKEMYPGTLVVSRETGYMRPYGRYPYDDYRTSDEVMFPLARIDSRLPMKERVLGLREGGMQLAFRIASFPDSVHAINHSFNGTDIVTVGSSLKNFAVSFQRETGERKLDFDGVDDRAALVMKDRQTGSGWDVFGNCVEGPLKGTRLEAVDSYIAFWFAWTAFFPDTELYEFR